MIFWWKKSWFFSSNLSFLTGKWSFAIICMIPGDRPWKTASSHCDEILHTELSHQYLGRVRRWEWFVKKWLSYCKKCHCWSDHPWRGVQGYLKKKYFSQNYLKYIWIDSVFNADYEYDICFELNHSFITKNCLKKTQNAQKVYLETKLPRCVSNDKWFWDFPDDWFCS